MIMTSKNLYEQVVLCSPSSANAGALERLWIWTSQRAAMTVKRMRLRQSARCMVQGLNDRALKDIGLTRADVRDNPRDRLNLF